MTIRDELLATGTRRYSTVSIPSVGELKLVNLTEGERVELSIASKQDIKHHRALLIIATVCDINGDRVFTKEDVNRILNMDSSVTGRLMEAIENHLEGISTAELEKNSGRTVGVDISST